MKTYTAGMQEHRTVLERKDTLKALRRRGIHVKEQIEKRQSDWMLTDGQEKVWILDLTRTYVTEIGDMNHAIKA